MTDDVIGPRVSVVIPVLDPGPGLGDLVGALQPDGDVEVILFDNGSTDGAPSAVAEMFANARVIRSETNQGFAAACNGGAMHASGEYLLFLNSDAFMTRAGLRELMRVADAGPRDAIWQPIIVTMAGGPESAGEFFTRLGFFVRREVVPSLTEPPFRAFACTGACLLCRRALFERLGRFRSSFFAYIEDVDLAWRGRLCGVEAWIAPSVRVRHQKNETALRVLSGDVVRYLTFRNRLRAHLANASGLSLVRILPLYVAASAATLLALASSGRMKSAAAVGRALIWPLMHPSEVIADRRQAQSLRLRSDREVLSHDVVVRLPIGRWVKMFREHRDHWLSS